MDKYILASQSTRGSKINDSRRVRRVSEELRSVERTLTHVFLNTPSVFVKPNAFSMFCVRRNGTRSGILRRRPFSKQTS